MVSMVAPPPAVFFETLDVILKRCLRNSFKGQTVKAYWIEASISGNESSDIDNRSAAKDLKMDSTFYKGLYPRNFGPGNVKKFISYVIESVRSY
jgi:hypothetical protein